jgi:hypothetical protein
MMGRLNRDELARIVGSNPRAIREFERILGDVQANISGQSAITLIYSSDGALLTPVPALYQYSLTASDQSVFRSGVSWGVTVLSGTFSGSGPTMGGTGTGVLQINSGIASPSATLAITARVDGRGYPAFTVTLNKSTNAPDSPGGGGTASDSTSSLLGFSSSGYAAITRELAITLPAGITQATLTATDIALALDNDFPDGATVVEVKWQRETAPSVWSDVGLPATSSPSPSVEQVFDPDLFIAAPGSVTCNRIETGMVAGSPQRFRLVARVSAGNVRAVAPFGTAGVTS